MQKGDDNMRNRSIVLIFFAMFFFSIATVAQNSVATYTLPQTGGSAQWTLIGTYSAGQGGNTVMITAFIHAGYNASNSQDSTYTITFNTSNGSSVDANGFAGNGSWYNIGYNNAIAPGNIKWVANTAGVNANAFSLYIYLPAYSVNSQYIVSINPGTNWTNVGSTGQTDPGAGSSTVMIPPVGFNLPYGNVGIGTTTPNALLSVQTGSEAPSTSGNASNGVLISTGSGGPSLSMGVVNTNTAGTQYGWLQTAYTNNAGVIGYLSLNPLGGNVGIGTTSPQAALEINGNLRFTADGSIQKTAWTGVLCGGDYAEAVNASGEKKSYEPGDVLVLASNANGNVEKSSEPYSTMVAGIYATKPGVIGRRQSLVKDADELPMAMVGIVPTKVSAENGAIRQGDLLVTSSKPGYAMKGTDRSRMLGAVIGKAMGSLGSGTGMIEVLVTLQ